MSGFYNVGMQGPGQSIVWTITAPTGVDLTAFTTRVLSTTFTFRDSTTLTLTSPDDWTLSNITASSLRATHVPTSDEFTVQGRMKVRATLTLDGVVYPLATQTEEVKAEPE